MSRILAAVLILGVGIADACSSVTVWDEAAKGRIVVGRTMDYSSDLAFTLWKVFWKREPIREQDSNDLGKTEYLAAVTGYIYVRPSPSYFDPFSTCSYCKCLYTKKAAIDPL